MTPPSGVPVPLPSSTSVTQVGVGVGVTVSVAPGVVNHWPPQRYLSAYTPSSLARHSVMTRRLVLVPKSPRTSASSAPLRVHFSAWILPEVGQKNVAARSAGTTCGAGGVTVGGEFWATGNNGAYSDSRIKANFKRIDNPLTRVRMLEGMTFDRLDIQMGRQAGLRAQQVRLACPEAVSELVGRPVTEVHQVPMDMETAFIVLAQEAAA